MTSPLHQPVSSPPAGRLDDRVAALVACVQGSESMHHAAHLVVSSAVELLGVERAALLSSGAGGLRLVVTSHVDLHGLESAQVDLGEGPGADVLLGPVPLVAAGSADLGRRWPRWGPRAVAANLRTVLAVRTEPATAPAVALTLYSARLSPFDELERRTARSFALHTGAALAARRTVAHLTRALETRTTIGQAQGVLIERYEITADQAFDVLRRYSQEHNVKLHELATSLVQTGQLPTASTEPPA